MNEIVSIELAKLLKKIGYHKPCSNCYIWYYGDPIEEEKYKDLPQIFTGEWIISYNFLLQDWEWNSENGPFDWVKIYYEKYHNNNDSTCEFFPFVDWNMNIFEIAQEKYLFDDIKKEDPEFWNIFQETFRYHEWFNNCKKGIYDYDEERRKVTEKLEKTKTGWEQGDDWEFSLYQEFLSAPSYAEVLKWLLDNKDLHINILYENNNLYKFYFSEKPELLVQSDLLDDGICKLIINYFK